MDAQEGQHDQQPLQNSEQPPDQYDFSEKYQGKAK